MSAFELRYTNQAQKDAKKAKKAGLKTKIEALLELVAENPFQNPPPFKRLVGHLEGAYSRRINFQHRLVYQVYKKEHIVKIIRLWTHYG